MPSVVPEIAGTFAGNYRILRPLGQGGMGTVYVAEQLTTGALRALKLMRRELCTEDRLLRLFQQEARIGHRIRSDHVVQVLDAGVDEATGTPWMAMELLEGEDLDAHVGREGPLPGARAAEVLGQIGHALAAAHEIGVVHRDLKPPNIFLATSQREGAPLLVKLLDFGIAKVVAEGMRTGTLVGTPLWMAPEQLLGAAVAPATDVWAFGLLAFWMLTGRLYWARPDGSALNPIHEIARRVSLVAASARAGELGCAALLPSGFDPWFARCTAMSPDARFAEAGAACEAIRRILGMDPPPQAAGPTRIFPAAVRPKASEDAARASVQADTMDIDTAPDAPPGGGMPRPELVREVLQSLARQDCPGVALLAPLGFDAQRVVADVLDRLNRPHEPLLPVRLVPERQGTSEERFYERQLRDLRWGLPASWRAIVDGRAEASAMDRFELAIEDLLGGPALDERRTLVLVVDGLAQVSTPQLERWGYLMARLSSRGLKILVWGGQELHELRTRPASGGRFSAFHVLRGIPVGPLSAGEVRALLGDRCGGAALTVLHEETGGHPALVRELVERYPEEARTGDRVSIAVRLLASDHLARLRRTVAAEAEAQEVLRALAGALERPLPRGRRPAEDRLRWLGVLREAGATGWDWTAPVMQRFAAEG
jgi:serine/threonine protein kinase